MATKKELIQELAKYGYEQSDFKSNTIGTLEKLLKKEQMLEALMDKVDLLSNKEEEKEDKKEAPVTETKAKLVKEVIPRERLVNVMSGVQGTLRYQSDTGEVYVFYNYGDTDLITYGELLRMRTRQRKFLDKNWIIILDDDVAEDFKIREQYIDILIPNDLDNIFSSEASVREFYEKSNESTREALMGFAIIRYNEGILTNLNIVRFFEQNYGVTFDSVYYDPKNTIEL